MMTTVQYRDVKVHVQTSMVVFARVKLIAIFDFDWRLRLEDCVTFDDLDRNGM